MTGTLIPIDGGRADRLVSETARGLRELADQVESGVAGEVVMIAIVNDKYQLESNCSIVKSIALSAILHDWCISRTKR